MNLLGFEGLVWIGLDRLVRKFVLVSVILAYGLYLEADPRVCNQFCHLRVPLPLVISVVFRLENTPSVAFRTSAQVQKGKMSVFCH